MHFQAKTIKELSKKVDALISIFGDDIKILASGYASAKIHTSAGQRVLDSEYQIEYFNEDVIYHLSFKSGVVIEKCTFVWSTFSINDILNLTFTVKQV
jgi:hypothetical protein